MECIEKNNIDVTVMGSRYSQTVVGNPMNYTYVEVVVH